MFQWERRGLEEEEEEEDTLTNDDYNKLHDTTLQKTSGMSTSSVTTLPCEKLKKSLYFLTYPRKYRT
jgi:hypothetical protein